MASNGSMAENLCKLFSLSLILVVSGIADAQQAPSVIDAVHMGHHIGHEQDGVEAVRASLAAGGDVNERDRSGWTPLMHAALECRAKIVKLLLDSGADPKLSGKKGQTPSFMDSGQTALTVASGYFIARRRAALAPERGMPTGYIDYELAAPAIMVHDLIARGGEVNAADADGRTPLMMAAIQGWSGVVRELLAAHAAVNVQDHEGRRAIDYVDPSNGDIVALLKNHGSGLSSGRSGRTVCDAERALDKLGYETPIVDCIDGQQFRAILVKFQKDHSLDATGELDSATRAALHIR